MEITARGLWTLIHGMGFGALYLLACSGALVELTLHHRVCTVRIHGWPRTLPEVYLITMVVLAWAAVLTRSLRHLSVVSRGASAGNSRSLDVSAAAADVEPSHHRLALAGDGVEGARRLVRSYLDHHGCVRFHPVWPRPQKSSTTSHRSALFCRGFVCCCGQLRVSSAR